LPEEFLTPTLSAGIAAATYTDPFTQKAYPPGTSIFQIMGSKFTGNIAPLTTLQQLEKAGQYQSGAKPTTKVLYPYSKGEVIGKFLTNTWPRALNVTESQSRAFSEKSAFFPHAEKERIKGQRTLKQYQDVTKMLGMQMPAVVPKAIALRAKRMANLAAFQDHFGRKLTTADRLIADMSFLVQNKTLDEARAKELLKGWANYPTATKDAIDRAIVNQYINTRAIGAWKKILNAHLDAQGKTALLGS